MIEELKSNRNDNNTLNYIYSTSHDMCGMLFSKTSSPLENRTAFLKSLKWPTGSTIRIKFLDGDLWKQSWVSKVIKEEIEPKVKNIYFSFVKPNEYADVKITFKHDGYGMSYVGTQCVDVPQDKPTTFLNSLDFPADRKFIFNNVTYTVPNTEPHPIYNNGRVIKHEINHVLGALHEHQNPINNPIEWDVEKTVEYYKNYGYDREWVITNVILKMPVDIVDATPFDPESIMMYTVLPELTTNDIGFVRKPDYSQKDLDFLKNYTTNTPQTNDTYNSYSDYVDNNKKNYILIIIIFIVIVIGIFVLHNTLKFE